MSTLGRACCILDLKRTKIGGLVMMDHTEITADLRTRNKKFIGRDHNRYWWYNLKDSDYIPPVYRYLAEEEWNILEAWFSDTEKRFSHPGEVGIPGISFLAGLIGGNGISRIVQCGHYVGYSSLLIGFLLRGMEKDHSLFSVDIDPEITKYTNAWLERAGLTNTVKTLVMDSADEQAPVMAEEWLGGPPQLVFIDSSHQYEHTIRELDRWYDHIVPGGFLLMHDVSIFAQAFDSTGQGGVLKAVQQWCKDRGVQPMLLNSFANDQISPNDLPYRDGCGMGIIQKPF